ncbi:hypothetical protein [Caldalkalibacillus salinus]|uniref:hypothetical protein n=1 Tax=Caldalkalibacillus salinus TaxID=2803787 RepID=UPI001920B3B2|nr:hypothetical protein [Caldalkalibacillus salinus]
MNHTIGRAERVLGIMSFVSVLLYLVHVFWEVEWIHLLYSVMAACLLAVAVCTVRKGNGITALLLFAIGSIIFIVEKVPALDVLHAFGQNMNLLALFVIVPLIGVMISVGGYLSALKAMVFRMERNGESHPYILSTVLTSTMGLVLNLGSMPIVFRIAEKSFSQFYKKRMGQVILRAFVFCMFWSPYFVNVGLISVLYDLSWADIGLVGLGIALIYLICSMVFFRWTHFEHDVLAGQKRVKETNGESLPQTQTLQTDGIEDAGVDAKASAQDIEWPGVKRKLKTLLIASFFLFFISLSLDAVTNINMLTIVSLMGLIYPFLWSIAVRQFRHYIYDAVEYVERSFVRLKNELAIFISAGYFGVALTFTPVGEWFADLIIYASFGHIYLMSIIVMIFVIFLATVGLHPVVVVIGIGGALQPELFSVSSEYMAILLLCAWALATSVSPFSGSVLMASSLMNISPWRVAKQNGRLVAFLVLLIPFVLTGLHMIAWL